MSQLTKVQVPCPNCKEPNLVDASATRADCKRCGNVYNPQQPAARRMTRPARTR